jgi:hypothetical protein
LTPESRKRFTPAAHPVPRVSCVVPSQIPSGAWPASKVAGTDLAEIVVLDVDATLVSAHSEKEQAAATFKGGFGFHPLGVWCDNTTELLAVTLRRATPAVTTRGTTSIFYAEPSIRSRPLVGEVY